VGTAALPFYLATARFLPEQTVSANRVARHPFVWEATGSRRACYGAPVCDATDP